MTYVQINQLPDFCGLARSTVNGVGMVLSDFGNVIDSRPDEASPGTCGDMKFVGQPSTLDVLVKYNITEHEYQVILCELGRVLSLGACTLCARS